MEKIQNKLQNNMKGSYVKRDNYANTVLIKHNIFNPTYKSTWDALSKFDKKYVQDILANYRPLSTWGRLDVVVDVCESLEAGLKKSTKTEKMVKEDAIISLVLPMAFNIMNSNENVLNFSSLFNAGVLSLSHAWDKYDARKGATFYWYAKPFVWTALKEEKEKQLNSLDIPATFTQQCKKISSLIWKYMKNNSGKRPDIEWLKKETNYLTKTVKTCLDFLGKTEKLTTRDEYEIGNTYGVREAIDVESLNSEQNFNNKIVKERLMNAVNKLPSKEREVIIAVFYKGLTLTETAGLFKNQVSRQCVTNWRDSALKHLKDIIDITELYYLVH